MACTVTFSELDQSTFARACRQTLVPIQSGMVWIAVSCDCSTVRRFVHIWPYLILLYPSLECIVVKLPKMPVPFERIGRGDLAVFVALSWLTHCCSCVLYSLSLFLWYWWAHWVAQQVRGTSNSPNKEQSSLSRQWYTSIQFQYYVLGRASKKTR